MNFEVVPRPEAGAPSWLDRGESGREVPLAPPLGGFCANTVAGEKREMPSTMRWHIRTVARMKDGVLRIMVAHVLQRRLASPMTDAREGSVRPGIPCATPNSIAPRNVRLKVSRTKCSRNQPAPNGKTKGVTPGSEGDELKLTQEGVPFYSRKVEVRSRILSLLLLLPVFLPSAGRSSNW